MHYSMLGSSNFNVTGSIDGKFEYGYLVTVKIGDEMLRGVLYHVPEQPQLSPNPSKMAGPMGSTSANGSILAQNRGGRKRRRKHKDPARPKPNRSAYNFFFAEKHARLKEMYPQREREYSKMIGESWNKLTTEEKMVSSNFKLQNCHTLEILEAFVVSYILVDAFPCHIRCTIIME